MVTQFNLPIQRFILTVYLGISAFGGLVGKRSTV